METGLNRYRKGLLNNTYFITKTITEDIKGDVLKGIYLKNNYLPAWCIIKEGRSTMWSDNEGRNMSDRLIWRNYIHDDIADKILMPKVLELFKIEQDMYLATEVIGGQSLTTLIHELYKGRTWLALKVHEQKKLLDLLLKVIDVVEQLHLNGYIHRNLTPANFLVTPKMKLYMIDWELAYNERIAYPLPAFAWGTDGFMSPEQERIEKPTIKEDIYGLGALMIVFLTNMPPQKFDLKRPDLAEIQLHFFIDNYMVSDLLESCLNELPGERPALHTVRRVIVDFKESIEQNEISSATVTLFIPTENEIITLILKAFDVLIERNWPGEHCGSLWGLTEITLSTNYGMLAGFFSATAESLTRIADSFCSCAEGLSLSAGIAGQAMAAAMIYKNDPTLFLKDRITGYVNIMVSVQAKDGYWSIGSTADGNNPFGLTEGIPGIIIALIKCDQLFPNENTQKSIDRGLAWLKRNVNKKLNLNEVAFIALAFLYAFEHSGKQYYKIFAEELLAKCQGYGMSSDYSLATGMAGVGLVYAEAFRITKNLKWERRAIWVYRVLENTTITTEDDRISWYMGQADPKDSSFFTGLSGIIYFLIKFRDRHNHG